MPDPSKNSVQWQRFGRHASRDFLMTVPKGGSHDQLRKPPSEEQVTYLRSRHPELMVGDTLIEWADEQFCQASHFAILVLKSECDEVDALLHQLEAVAKAFAQRAESHGGNWGLLHQDLLALFLPKSNSGLCRAMALDIQNQLASDDSCPISGGVASYPTDRYQRNQVLENAIKALYHAGFCDPNAVVVFDAVSLNISGDRLYNQGDIAGAINEFIIASRLDPANANVLNSLGVAYGVLGHYPKALEAFRMAIRLDAGEGIAHYNYGLVQLLLGDLETALSYFKDAKTHQTDIFEVSLQLGQLFMQRQDWPQALVHLSEAIRLNPHAGLAYRLKGDCHVKSMDWSAAKKAYAQAIRINPEDAAALSALAAIYGRLGENLELAKIFAEQSITLAPEDGLFHQRLGNLYHRNGDIEKAQAAFERATALGVSCADIIWMDESQSNAAS
jgi:tetratricopeptide (TPR) repeat protein